MGENNLSLGDFEGHPPQSRLCRDSSPGGGAATCLPHRGRRCPVGTVLRRPSRQARRWPGKAGPEGAAFREIPSPLFPSVEGEGRQPALNAGGEAGSYSAVLRWKPQCANRPAGATEQFFGGFIAALFATGGDWFVGGKGVENARPATEKFFGELSFKKAPTLAHRNGVTFARRPPWGETKKGDGFPCPTTHTGWNLPGR